jgi:phage baseplate assembly protein W
MGVWDDITGAKGFHLYAPGANAAKGMSVNLGTGFVNDLFGPKSDYMLEVWIKGELKRTVMLPIHPQAIEITRPQASVVNYTMGYLANREHTMHRNLDIKMNGWSGVATRQAHDREGNTVMKPGPYLIREIDAFLDYYNAMCVQMADYFNDPGNYRKNYNAVTLVFRSFSEHLHVRVEPTNWRMRRSTTTTRFGYEWELRLQAYGPATPKKAPALLSQIGDCIAFATKAVSFGSSFVAMGANAVDGGTGIANGIRGPLQAAQTMANQLDKLSGSLITLVNTPRLFMRDCAQAFSTARNAYARLASEKGGGYDSIKVGMTREQRNIEQTLGLLEEGATDAVTAAGALGATFEKDPNAEEAFTTAGPSRAGWSPNEDPAGPTAATVEQYSMPGPPSIPWGFPILPPTIPVSLIDGDNLLSLAKKWLGDSRYWMAIATVNSMPTPYYNKTGTPLKAGDVLLIPQNNPILEEAQLSPTQDLNTDRFGRDLYLNPVTGDLDIINQEDIRTVFDKENLEQAIRNRLLTRQGDSSYWPTYGLPRLIGTKVTQETASYVAAHLNAQLLTDPRVVEVSAMRLVDEGDTLVSYIEVVPIIGTNVAVISPI